MLTSFFIKSQRSKVSTQQDGCDIIKPQESFILSAPCSQHTKCSWSLKQLLIIFICVAVGDLSLITVFFYLNSDPCHCTDSTLCDAGQRTSSDLLQLFSVCRWSDETMSRWSRAADSNIICQHDIIVYESCCCEDMNMFLPVQLCPGTSC